MMAKLLPELGDWSEEETKTLAIHALNELRLQTRIKAVQEAFTDEDERDQLATAMNEDED